MSPTQDLRLRLSDYREAQQRAATADTAARQALATNDLAAVETLSNDVALAYRQLATTAWELARARRLSREVNR